MKKTYLRLKINQRKFANTKNIAIFDTITTKNPHTMLIKKRTIESHLPIFTGFYNTLFEPNEEMIIEEPYNYDDYEFDYKDYQIDMSKACCNAIESELKPLEIKVEYQNIDSPQFYNFRNDSINVKYKLSKNTAKLLNKYLVENSEKFAEYLENHFKSRDGFISFFSYDLDSWLNEYTHEKLETTFGFMLDFYLLNEGYDQEKLYYACDNVYLQGGLKTGVQEATEYIREYANSNYTKKPLETIVIELTQHFEANDIEYDFLTFTYIENIVKEVFESIDNKTGNLFASVK